MRDQRRRIDCLAVGLRVQRGVAVEVGFQAGRAGKGQLRGFRFRQRPQPQLARRHREVPRLKKSGWYGRSTRSRLTMMRTGKPGRSVKVGWMLRLRRVISWPT